MSIGFLDFAVGTSSLLATGASAFSTVYGTLEGTKLAEDHAKLQGKIALGRAGLEEEILNVQKNIFLSQQQTMEKSNEIDLQIKKAKADLEIQKIQNQHELLQNNHNNQKNSNQLTVSNVNNIESSNGHGKYMVGGFVILSLLGVFFAVRK